LEILNLIGRTERLFQKDIINCEFEICKIVESSSFLVLGGAGSIGCAVVKEIFKRNPKRLHIVDISENNLVELVRDIRSSFGYIIGDFRTFALDIGSDIYNTYFENQPRFDYVLNLSALKHVRSEKDIYTLMRMIEVNIFNTDKTLVQAISAGTRKYFAVSTDKAANPVNLMGASKRIMEKFLLNRSRSISISTARFANVAFSDGSLLHGFNQRIQKRQPLVAPNDVKRYFVTPEESGELCLMSALFGENRDVFFPKENEGFVLTSFADITIRYLTSIGFEPFICSDENEARERIEELIPQKKWPCLFTSSDTTGEKEEEEFYSNGEILDLVRFNSLGIIKNDFVDESHKIDAFRFKFEGWKQRVNWNKEDIVGAFREIIPEFYYEDLGKYLDQKM
jgi:FlaA1/EpsC-like NDP-sugar epimerase